MGVGFEAALSSQERIMHEFFINELTVAPITGRRQNSKYVENQRWVVDDVMYVTVHITGNGDNCFQQNPDGSIGGSLDNIPESCTSERTERVEANLAWLRDSFKIAKRKRLLGVGIFAHAPLFFSALTGEDGSCPADASDNCILYEVYRMTLVEGITTLNKPVGYFYGSGHFFGVQVPVTSLPNFSYIQTGGHPDTTFIRVTVDTSNTALFAVDPPWETICIRETPNTRTSINCDPEIRELTNEIATSSVEIFQSDECGNGEGAPVNRW